MCGIVGAVGLAGCSGTLLDSLKRLEYRGYDSSGIVTQQDGQFSMNRAVGKLVNLQAVMTERPLSATFENNNGNSKGPKPVTLQK